MICDIGLIKGDRQHDYFLDSGYVRMIFSPALSASIFYFHSDACYHTKPKTQSLLFIDLLTRKLGHETTSGLLSFLFYHLLKNPAALQRAREEVDAVVGTSAVKVGHLRKIPYITACLREALRLNPTASVFGVKPSACSTRNSINFLPTRGNHSETV